MNSEEFETFGWIVAIVLCILILMNFAAKERAGLSQPPMIEEIAE